MAAALARLEAALVATLKTMLGLALIVMVVVNVANAAARYSGLTMLAGADELLVFTMIFIVMVGAVLASRDRGHLTIDLLPQRFGPRGRRALTASTNALSALVCGFVAVHSFAFAERIGALGQTSMGLKIPMVVPHLTITLGFIGMAAVFALLGLVDLTRRRCAT